ncbi:MAG: DUF4157 domain-containing protein [Acidobacteriota bacterium]|nr:DUF4157 domain-containing protein [Acidobacteriota bacterium]
MTLPHLSARHSTGRPRYTRYSMAKSRRGLPLPESLRVKMEAFFNHDFSNVRLHIGPEARAIGALAFTHGNHIYLAPGQYNPDSEDGIKLLGHELAHVVQQSQGRVANPYGRGVAVVNDDSLEAEADRLGEEAARHVLGKPFSREIADHGDCGHGSHAPRDADPIQTKTEAPGEEVTLIENPLGGQADELQKTVRWDYKEPVEGGEAAWTDYHYERIPDIALLGNILRWESYKSLFCILRVGKKYFITDSGKGYCKTEKGVKYESLFALYKVPFIKDVTIVRHKQGQSMDSEERMVDWLASNDYSPVEGQKIEFLTAASPCNRVCTGAIEVLSKKVNTVSISFFNAFTREKIEAFLDTMSRLNKGNINCAPLDPNYTSPETNDQPSGKGTSPVYLESQKYIEKWLSKR